MGDTITLGSIQGTIEDITLRSTRIGTFDRIVVSVPNGQISNMPLENLSTRDKFWFHPILALRFGTSAAQIRTVIVCIRSLLERSEEIAPNSVHHDTKGVNYELGTAQTRNSSRAQDRLEEVGDPT